MSPLEDAVFTFALACTESDRVIEVHGVGAADSTPPEPIDTGGGGTESPPPPEPTDDSGTPPAFEPVIDAVTPSYGSNLGGLALTVDGRFDDATVIEVDGVAAERVSGTATERTVALPGSTTTGWVDVTARSGPRAATSPEAFQYWADGTGATGLWGWVGYLEMVGDYWVDPADSAYAELGFTEPYEGSLQDGYSPTLDTCLLGVGAYDPPTYYDTGAAVITLTSGTRTIALVPQPLAPGAFSADVLEPLDQVLPGAVYDLDPVAGSADWPGFDVPAAVQVPPAFAVTGPDLDAADPPLVGKNQLTFTWEGAAGDFVALYLVRMIGGTTPDVSVTCAATDDGSFTVPGSIWPEWDAGDYVFVQLGRVYESSGALPHDNSDNRLAGIYWVMGAVEAR